MCKTKSKDQRLSLLGSISSIADRNLSSDSGRSEELRKEEQEPGEEMCTVRVWVPSSHSFLSYTYGLPHEKECKFHVLFR